MQAEMAAAGEGDRLDSFVAPHNHGAPIPWCSRPWLAQGSSLTSSLTPMDVEQHIPGCSGPIPGCKAHTKVWDAQRGMLNPLPPAATAGWLPAPVPEHLDHYHSTSWHQAGASPSATLPPAAPCSAITPWGQIGQGAELGGTTLPPLSPTPQSPPGPSCLMPDVSCSLGKLGVCEVTAGISEIFLSQYPLTPLRCCSSSASPEAGMSMGTEGRGERAEQSWLGSSSSSEGVMGS